MKSTKLALVLALVPFLGLAACAEQAGEEAGGTMEMAMTADLDAVAEAFAVVRAEYKRAFEAGDATSLAALYAEDAKRLPPDAEVQTGRAAIEQDFAAGFAESTSREITITETEVGASGNLAYSIGTYSVTYEAEGMAEGMAEPVTDGGEYLVVSKMLDDGSWQIVAHMWTSDMAAAMMGSMGEG